jgi:outer membrane cobalamin receptor
MPATFVLLLLARLTLPASLSGTVQSVDHKPIPAATVVAQQNGRTFTAVADDNGAFTLADVTLPVTVEVRATGFTTVRQTADASPVAVTLSPSEIRESIVVTGSAPGDWWRRPMTGTTVLTAESLEKLPAVTMDEALRVVSGLSLFRRSSSRSSNPTTHGVTMRGLSASGSSRGLVMLDGMPLNDGFGGWVTWTRLPVLATSSVSLDRGAEGATFGSDALGGVIDMTTQSGEKPSAAASIAGGSIGVGAFDGSAGGRVGSVNLFGAASWFTTDGVIPVAPESRGAADVPADAEWYSGIVKVSGRGEWGHLAASILAGSDDRGNGTVLQRNHMEGGTAAIAYDGPLQSATLAVRASFSPNHFRQTFSTVAAGRATETLTSEQAVDGSTMRGVVEVGRPIPKGFLTGRAMITRGGDDFTEVKFGAPVPHNNPNVISRTTMALRDDGEAVAVQAAWNPASAVSIGAGLRSEWRKAPIAEASRDNATVGQVSASWRVSDLVTLRSSAATSHRWPTLNELVRNFQVGSILTQANPDLAPERAKSVDAAIAFVGAHWNASMGGFWTNVDDAIANVTIQTTPTIIRQRRNAGRAEARGGELDVEARPWTFTTLRLSAVLTDSHFRDSLEPALEGKWLPQVPSSSVSASGDVRIQKWLQVAALYRWIAPQFDDDRNAFELAEFSQFDVRVFGQIRSITWQFTVENAGDSRIEVGKTPLVTLAPGRSVRAGITWRK